MTSTVTRRVLWGAGLSILLSVGGGAAVFFGLPQRFQADAATEAPAAAAPPAVPVSVAKAESRRITTWRASPAVSKRSSASRSVLASAARS